MSQVCRRKRSKKMQSDVVRTRESPHSIRTTSSSPAHPQTQKVEWTALDRSVDVAALHPSIIISHHCCFVHSSRVTVLFSPSRDRHLVLRSNCLVTYDFRPVSLRNFASISVGNQDRATIILDFPPRAIHTTGNSPGEAHFLHDHSKNAHAHVLKKYMACRRVSCWKSRLLHPSTGSDDSKWSTRAPIHWTDVNDIQKQLHFTRLCDNNENTCLGELSRTGRTVCCGSHPPCGHYAARDPHDACTSRFVHCGVSLFWLTTSGHGAHRASFRTKHQSCATNLSMPSSATYSGHRARRGRCVGGKGWQEGWERRRRWMCVVVQTVDLSDSLKALETD